MYRDFEENLAGGSTSGKKILLMLSFSYDSYIISTIQSNDNYIIFPCFTILYFLPIFLLKYCFFYSLIFFHPAIEKGYNFFFFKKSTSLGKSPLDSRAPARGAHVASQIPYGCHASRMRGASPSTDRDAGHCQSSNLGFPPPPPPSRPRRRQPPAALVSSDHRARRVVKNLPGDP